MSKKEPEIKIVLHKIGSSTELPTDVIKTAQTLLDAPEGNVIVSQFGARFFLFRRYKQSVSVWPRNSD